MTNSSHTGPSTAKTGKSIHWKIHSPEASWEQLTWSWAQEMPTTKFTGGFCETKTNRNTPKKGLPDLRLWRKDLSTAWTYLDCWKEYAGACSLGESTANCCCWPLLSWDEGATVWGEVSATTPYRGKSVHTALIYFSKGPSLDAAQMTFFCWVWKEITVSYRKPQHGCKARRQGMLCNGWSCCIDDETPVSSAIRSRWKGRMVKKPF